MLYELILIKEIEQRAKIIFLSVGRYHKLLLITEIIFCSNPKAVWKILLFSYQSNVNFCKNTSSLQISTTF